MERSRRALQESGRYLWSNAVSAFRTAMEMIAFYRSLTARLITWVAVSVAVFSLMQSCSDRAPGTPQPSLNVSGRWTGKSFPGCRSNHGVNCYQRPIAFDFVQNGRDISGSYSCPFGDMMCGLDNSGKIVGGKLEGSYLSDLRVVFSDATNCLYQGQFADHNGSGEYMCFAGAGRIVEQGGWRLEHSVASKPDKNNRVP